MNKKLLTQSALFFAITVIFTSCRLAAKIFKAGMFTGGMLVVVIIVVVIYTLYRSMK